MDNTTSFFVSILISLFITILFYLSAPLIAKYIFKKEFTEKNAIKFMVANCIIVYIIFSIIQILSSNHLANISPAILWGIIGYIILKPQKKYNKAMIDENKQTEDFVNAIEKNITNKNTIVNNNTNILSKTDFIKLFSEQTGLPQNVCIDIYYITLNFNNKEKDLAYNLIESKLIPDLIQNNSVAQVGIAFGSLIQEELCLTESEANAYVKKIVDEMVNLNGIK